MNDTPLSARFAEKAADLAALEAAVLTVAESVGQGLTPDAWRHLTCNEVEQVAEMFRLAGDEDTAKHIIESHAEYDEPGDDHYTPPVVRVTFDIILTEPGATVQPEYIVGWADQVAEATANVESITLVSIDTEEQG